MAVMMVSLFCEINNLIKKRWNLTALILYPPFRCHAESPPPRHLPKPLSRGEGSGGQRGEPGAAGPGRQHCAACGVPARTDGLCQRDAHRHVANLAGTGGGDAELEGWERGRPLLHFVHNMLDMTWWWWCWSWCLFEGLACLHLAALNRQHQILTLLSKMGADLNIQVSPAPPPTLVCFCSCWTLSNGTKLVAPRVT